MAEHWTQEQALANADLNAKEFANRQILLRGVGLPTMQAPIGAEYEDTSFSPAKRYRKTGLNSIDWTLVLLIEKATSQEVENGVNDVKMITPVGLANKLDDFAAQVLNLPPQSTDTESSLLTVQAGDNSNNAAFSIDLPNNTNDAVLSVIIESYGLGASLANIIGGVIGQMVNIRRGETHALSVSSSANIKLSEQFDMDDTSLLDNMSLQKISEGIWVEVTRKNFS